MKRIKFLSFATLVALMTLGLASCEKENFNRDIPQALPASVIISPQVIAVIDGIAKNVTYDDATTIDYATRDENNNIIKKLPEADKESGKIKKQDVIITATYKAKVEIELANGEKVTLEKELTEKETIKVPELKKGMSCTFTPTIFLSFQTKEDAAITAKGTESYSTETQKVTVKNITQYFYTDVNGKYEYKAGTEVDRNSINWLQASYKNDYEINHIIDSFDQPRTETQKVENIVVYAQSQTIITATTQIATTEYTIKKKVSLVTARAEESKESEEIEIVKFNVKKYISTEDNHGVGPKTENPDGYEVDVNLNGIGHGHGHGHGHGNSANAGGGIVWGE